MASNEDEPTVADQTVEKLLTAFWLYGGYTINSRGPAGLIMDVIKLNRPDIAQAIENGDDIGEVRERFFPE